MPQTPAATPLLATDPGLLYWAPLGTADPANTVAGSVFTDSPPVAWVRLGATEEGHNFNWQTSFDPVTVAELNDPVRYVSTGRTGSVAFALVDFTVNNVKRAMNGGTITTTGTAGTTMSRYSPPTQGAETRCILLWESTDQTERWIFRQCINTGSVSIARRKGADNANIPVEFMLEAPISGFPFDQYAAGAARLGV